MLSKSKLLAYSGLMTALTFISTTALAIPVPLTGGFIHMGDAMVLSCGVVLGKKYGALAAGIGSALADLTLGYTQWALPTLLIKALMAFIVGYLFEAPKNKKRHLLVISICISVWVGFSFILHSLLTTIAISNTIDAMINDKLVTNLREAFSLANTTQTILLFVAIILPLLILIFLYLSKNKPTFSIIIHRFIVFITAGSIMVIFYYLTYGILYGNWILPIFSVPSNILQYTVGVLIALGLLPLTSKFSLIDHSI